MSDARNKVDKVKGHAKEAVGDLTGDDELRREGKRDRLAGGAKEKAEQVKDMAEEGVDRVEEGIDKVKDKLGARDRS
jgi:uncharacterized protein YjbJ (UPF0337 family)